MTTSTTTATPLPLDWAGLRARYKEIQAQTKGQFQNWQIRVHRSLSWLKRAGELGPEQEDMACILMWISLNALYSRWDAERNMPAVDQGTRQRFLGRICDLAPQLMGQTLQKQRPLVKKILENAYLSPVFWRDPANPKAKGWAAEDANYLDRNLRQHDYCRVLNQVMDRLFVMRGQLVHGGATGGGKLNRRSLQHCLALLRAVLPVLLHIVMEKMCDDDWPELCYPPVD